MTFADKLLKLRKQENLSQEQLAEILDVSRQAVSRWELGTTLPDANNLMHISKLFHVSIDYLLNDEVENNQQIPIVKETEKQMQMEWNRKVALMVSVGLHMLIFVLGVILMVINQISLSVFFYIFLHIVNIFGFELAFRLKGKPDERAYHYRSLYYRICIWLFAYFPVRFILLAIFSLLDLGKGAIIPELIIFLAYVGICLAVNRYFKGKDEPRLNKS